MKRLLCKHYGVPQKPVSAALSSVLFRTYPYISVPMRRPQKTANRSGYTKLLHDYGNIVQ
jgi:hypothetical protein